MAGWAVLTLPIFLFYRTVAYNLDTYVPVVKEGLSANSYFGYSVAQHLKGVGRKATFLVGAPKANITATSENVQVRNLVSPGTAYQCPLSPKHKDCTEVYLQIYTNEGTDWDKKDLSNMWMGVTVRSSGTLDGKAVVCGHRMRNFARSVDGEIDNEWANGKCIILDNNLDVDQEDLSVEPCANRGRYSGGRFIDTYGYCQSGISADLNIENDLVIGTPGPFTWTGMMTLKPLFNESNIFKEIEEIHTQPELKKEPAPAVRPYSYLGMSSSLGHTLGKKTYITGATRSEGNGQVLLMEARQDPAWGSSKSFLVPADKQAYLTGEQLGSMFGHAVAPIDINNDGMEDLVVSAPFYRDKDTRDVGGAIYVFMNGPEGINENTKPVRIVNKMSGKQCAEVQCEHARFGFSVVNAGDLDLDGYPDIAVSAPYEGNGVVYIFHGSATGLIEEPAQRIEADSLLTARPLKSFGYSLSGGVDMDDNGYPDLMVGSFQSNKALLLRTRPVINIWAQFTASPREVNTTDGGTCMRAGQKIACFQIRVCLKFTAKPYRNFQNSLAVTYTIHGDYTKKHPRVFFDKTTPQSANKTRDVRLHEQSRDEVACKDDTVYLNRDLQDKLEPIMLKLKVALRDQVPPTMSQFDAIIPSLNNYPILNKRTEEHDLQVDFLKQCGADRTCNSSLSLEAKFHSLSTGRDGVPILEVKSLQQVLPVRITISNRLEEAHRTMLHVKLPEAISYSDTDQRGKKYSCQYGREDNFVNCSIGNPMKVETAKFTMFLDTFNLTPKDKDLTVDLFLTTTSVEKDPSDDFRKLRLRVVVKTDVALYAKSDPESDFFSGEIKGESAMVREEDVGRQIKHIYILSNEGVGSVKNISVEIRWPYELEMGETRGRHLLYLIEEPKISEAGKCFIDRKWVNPLGLTVNPENEIVIPNKNAVDVNITESGPGYNIRTKRYAAPEPRTITDRKTGKRELVAQLNCRDGTAKCFTFYCQVGLLNQAQSVEIHIRSLLWNSTFLMHYKKVHKVEISSHGKIRFDPKYHIEQNNTSNDQADAVTVVRPDVEVAGPAGVPLWVIIVAAVAGIVLLIIIVVLLWACGFFKRDRPEYTGRVEKKKSYYDDTDMY